MTDKELKFTKYISRLILVIILLLIGGWLVAKDLVVTGKMTIVNDFSKDAPFFSEFKPGARAQRPEKVDGEYSQTVISDPVYLDITTPRRFHQAEVEVAYQGDHYLFEVGLTEDKELAKVLLKPLEYKSLEIILRDDKWNSLRQDSLILLQKNNVPQFISVDQFLSDPPSNDSFAVYHADLAYEFKIPNYQAANRETVINHSLRGSHTIFTYIKNEDLNFTLVTQDMNRSEGNDQIIATVYNQDNEEVYKTTLPDDGNLADDQKSSGLRDVKVNVAELSEGVYAIHIETSLDNFIRRIKTTQKYVSFLNGLYLGDMVGYQRGVKPEFIYTNGRRLTAQTRHHEGLQTLAVNQQAFPINEIHQQYAFDVSNQGKLSEIFVPKNDIFIHTNGFFAFKREQFFNPLIQQLNEDLDLNQEGLSYILAEYSSPTRQGEWKVAKARLVLDQFYKNDQFRLVFSAPGLTEDQPIKISNIKLKLSREHLTRENFSQRWTKLKQKFNQYVSGLK